MKNFCYIAILSLVTFFTNATTIKVGANFPVKKIKQAIALAKDGDTIIVTSGIYKEGTVVINKK